MQVLLLSVLLFVMRGCGTATADCSSSSTGQPSMGVRIGRLLARAAPCLADDRRLDLADCRVVIVRVRGDLLTRLERSVLVVVIAATRGLSHVVQGLLEQIDDVIEDLLLRLLQDVCSSKIVLKCLKLKL